jgi:hypothetical protein
MRTNPGGILQPGLGRTLVVGIGHGRRRVIFIVPCSSIHVLRLLRRHDELGTNAEGGLSLTFYPLPT